MDGSATAFGTRTLTLNAANFGYGDADGDLLLAIRIVTPPSAGSLTYDPDGPGGADPVPVVAGQIVSRADIDAGRLVFTPAAGATNASYTSLNFQVQDASGAANSFDTTPNTLTLGVIAAAAPATAAVTVSGTSQLTIAAGRALSVAGTAIKWSAASTGVVIDNSGVIESTDHDGRAFNASGATTGAHTLTFTNRAGALVQSENDALRINIDIPQAKVKIVNAGTIVSTVSGQAIDFDAVATTTASGQIEIDNLATGVIRANGADAVRPGQLAVINNAGLIYAAGAPGDSNDGVDFQLHSGTVNNLAGGTISGQRHGITTSIDVIVTNAVGAEIIGRNGSGVGSDGTGTVTNYGTIIGAYDGSTNGDGDGIDIDGYATIDNYGVIMGTGAGGVDKGGDINLAEGLAITGGGIVTNHAGGYIYGALRAIFGDGGLVVVNDGAISGQTYGTVLFGGTPSHLTNSGTISSSGFAVFAQSGTGTTVANNASGVISSGFVGVYAISADVTNSGRIYGASDGFDGAGGSLLNTATGTITGDTYGLNLFGAIAVTNQGTISAPTGIFINSGDAVPIINAGTISASGFGIFAQGGPGTTIANTAAGSIVAGYGGIYSVGAGITNGGAITGGTYGVVMGGGSVLNTATGTITSSAHALDIFDSTSIVNRGAISGDIAINAPIAGAVAIVNAGTIAGTSAAILLGAGDDSLTIRQGSQITGMVDGGAGTDTLTLESGATFVRATSFEQLVVTGDAAILGDNALLGTTIAAGATLTLGNGGTAGAISGDVALNGGRLAIARSNALTLTGVLSGIGGITQAGTGTTTLSAIETYTGATVIGAGTLALAGTASIAASSAVTVTGTLDLSGLSGGARLTTLAGSGTVTLGADGLALTTATGSFAGNIAGAGALSVTSAGSAGYTLSGSAGWTGGAAITSGATLILAGSFAALGGTLTIAGTLDIASAGTLAASLAGAGAFVKDGAGTLTLGAAGSFSGIATIAAGTLRLANGAALGTGTIDFGHGEATLLVADGVTFARALGGAGFGVGDSIDLAGFAAATASLTATTGGYRLADAAGHAVDLAIATASGTHLVLGSDADGHALLTAALDPSVARAAAASVNEGGGRVAVVLAATSVNGTLDHFVIDGVPAHGGLYASASGGSALASGANVTSADGTATVWFEPAAHYNGVTSFGYTAWDGATAGTSAIATLTVTSVNDAPSATDAALTILEDTPRVLAAADFGFADVDGNALLAVRIVTLPGAGLLAVDGVAVVAGQAVSAADLAAGKLVYTPAANATAPTGFTFRVQDDGGVANGGIDVDPVAHTVAFTITPVNDAPSATDAALTILEDTPRVLAAADFGFADVDGNALLAVRIVTLPGAGLLAVDGVAVAAGQAVSAADLAAGKLVYTPAANATASTGFTFRVQDDGGIANGGIDVDPVAHTVGFTITPVDDAPVAVADVATVAENATVTLAVLANDTDIDGGPKAVASIAGVTVTAGQRVTLASGAVVTFNADGTIGYDPNHKFDYLVSATTALSNGSASSADDSFSYALNGGSLTTVSVHITGVDGAGDQLRGTAGADTLIGTAGADFFYLNQGGSDHASGGAGNDAFYMGAMLDADDVLDGGEGTGDEVALQGNYAHYVFGAQNLLNVETLSILPGFDARFGDTAGNHYSYNLTTVDANVAAGQQLTINANRLTAGENLTFDGSAETDGHFLFYGGLGTETLTGSQQSDLFYFGNDGRFAVTDHVDGQGGADDQLGIRGNYGDTQLVFEPDTIKNIETLSLLSGIDTRFGAAGVGFAYNVKLDDANVAAGQQFTVNANNLQANEHFIFDGSAETDGFFRIIGGAGNDTAIGGAGNDLLYGAKGADTLTGGGGNDTFLYRAVADSTASAMDHILDFDDGDLIDLATIDASTVAAGNNAFTFIGADAFHHVAGELRATLADGLWTVAGDVDGDGIADLVIAITTAHGHVMGVGDFVL